MFIHGPENAAPRVTLLTRRSRSSAIRHADDRDLPPLGNMTFLRPWWAVPDLNLGPLACHAHISCSPPLSDVQISPHRSTFCPLRFVIEFTYSPALLTALLTKCLCMLCKCATRLRQRPLGEQPYHCGPSPHVASGFHSRQGRDST